jgi:AcrR family transcriptional regulator
LDLERRAEIARERRARTRGKLLSAAFDLFGTSDGLYIRPEDVAARAGVTRQTVYNHFAGMAELRAALTHEVTHDYLVRITRTIEQLDDPIARAAAAVRFYLRRAQADPQWAWSMINLSANGPIFGTETSRQAQDTVAAAIAACALPIESSMLGRDILLGSALAAMAAMLRDETPGDYPEQVAERILLGLGVGAERARSVARAPLPEDPGP